MRRNVKRLVDGFSLSIGTREPGTRRRRCWSERHLGFHDRVLVFFFEVSLPAAEVASGV